MMRRTITFLLTGTLALAACASDDARVSDEQRTSLPRIAESPPPSFSVFSSSESSVSLAPRSSARPSEPGGRSGESEDEFDPLSKAQGIDLPSSVDLDVPFTSQAPFADWSPTFNEACEEAALLMAEYFLRGESFTPERATEEIVSLVSWEESHGLPHDITSKQVARVARDVFGRKAVVYTGNDVTAPNIRLLLAAGYPVIIPAAGQMLGNPYFRGAGPPYHMLVIRGYKRGSFITNDPGTRRGEEYRYDEEVIMDAIHDWTGSKDTIRRGQKAMIVIGK